MPIYNNPQEEANSGLPFDQLSPEAQRIRTGGQTTGVQDLKPLGTAPQVNSIPQVQQQPVVQQPAPVAQPTQQPDATIAQGTTQPLQVGGKFGTQQFGRMGNDVYEIMSDGSRRKVTEAEFNQKLKAQGLNLDVLPQLDLNDNVDDTPGGASTEFNEDGTMAGPSDFLTDYKNIISELGLTDIKGEFEKNKKAYEDLLNTKNEEILEVNNDPWLSASVRKLKTDKINARYEAKENTISNLMKYNESLYEEGLAQAKFIATGIQIDRNKLLDIALKREEALADLIGEDYELREVGGSLYRVDKKTGKSELLIKGVGAAGTGTDLTGKQLQTFLTISNKFQADTIMGAAGNATQALAIADQVLANPNSAGNQLSILYTLVKSLDPNSAVREGEIALAQTTQSYLSRFQTNLERINEGKPISAEAAKELARATKNLANLWYQAGQRREGQYKSQASIAGVGDAFDDYLTGFSRPYAGGTTGGSPEADLQDDILSLGSTMTREQLADELFKDYGKDGFTRDEIYFDYVLNLIPDKPTINFK